MLQVLTKNIRCAFRLREMTRYDRLLVDLAVAPPVWVSCGVACVFLN
jgi:hypothetical protein